MAIGLRNHWVSPLNGACWKILTGVLLLLALRARAAVDSSPRDDFWMPSGPVRALAETNGILYVGGLFDYIGPVPETGQAFDAASGATLPDFPPFAGAIKTILNDSAGGWFVGGFFTSVGGLPLTNLAHILSDRTVDASWAPNPNNTVMTLASDGERLFVGGAFASIGGQERRCVAALDPGTGVPLNWRADSTYRGLFPQPTVNSLVAEVWSTATTTGRLMASAARSGSQPPPDVTTGSSSMA